MGVGSVGVGSVSSGLELEERKRTAGLVCNGFLVK